MTNNYESKNLLKIINKIDPSNKMAILIGSGFAENIFKDSLIFKRENFGNDFQTISKTKSEFFFKELKKNKILHPTVSNSKPKNGKWLIKGYRSFGGEKVKFLKKSKIFKKSYFQKFIKGEPISVQFFVKNNKVSIFSICDQIKTDSEKGCFLEKSLITKKVTKEFFNKIFLLTLKISRIFSLNGINSLDLIEKNQKLFLLEVNPRPGLSCRIINLIGKKFAKTLVQPNEYFYYSSTIIYAKKKIFIDKNKYFFLKKISLSNVFSELPSYGDMIKVDEPLCLLHLKSKSKKFLKKKIEEKESEFLEKIENI